MTLFPIVRIAALFLVVKERSRTFRAMKNTSSTRLGANTLSKILMGDAMEIATETLTKRKRKQRWDREAGKEFVLVKLGKGREAKYKETTY